WSADVCSSDLSTHTVSGDVWLTDSGALTLGAITTTGGDVDVRTTGAGTLTAGGTIASGGGAVLLSSQDALAVNNISAGAGTVQLLANQDAVGTQVFSQTNATTISGTGISITVNTAATVADDGGGAVVATITDSGALSITTNNGTNDSTGNITRTASSTLSGASVSLTTGKGSIGTGTSANAINLAAGQTGVTASTHTVSGDVWLTDSGALTLGAITTT